MLPVCLDWSLFVCSTWRQTDPVPILEFKAVAAELALPAFHVRFFLVELVNDDVKLSLQDVYLPFGKFLLAPPQRLLLTLLLQRRSGQLLLPWPQFLREREEQLKKRMLKAAIKLIQLQTDRLQLNYLLLGPQLIKHFLDLQFPVILKGVEGLCWHLKKAWLLDGCELVQNSREERPRVRVWAPAVCDKQRKKSMPQHLATYSLYSSFN